MASKAGFQVSEQAFVTTLAPGSFARAARAAALIRGVTKRQHQVLELMSAGQMNKQIAHLLNLSEKTVKMHRKLLLEGLGVQSSAAAVRLFVEASFLIDALSPELADDSKSASSNVWH
jgi:DNA-binding NarL/FixJ family response regulator